MKTFLKANWQNLIMANYEIDPNILTPYLPNGVTLDYYQEKMYVSLVGFLFKNTSIFSVPIPWMGTFEEVNLRFYVTRKVGNITQRGVVFINETVPNKIVAWVANKLYKEHYTAIPTKHNWSIDAQNQQIEYQWKVKSKWQSMLVNAEILPKSMPIGSMEEFIFEHYYGYTKVDSKQSIAYKINHPQWQIFTVNDYIINCHFESFYGSDFKILDATPPHSVFLAQGSDISVDWQRVSF